MIRDKILTSIYKKWETERDKSFLELLEPNPSVKVVDLGCGKGDFTLKVKEVIGVDKIYGVDLWEEGLEEAKKRGIITFKKDLNEKLDCFPDNYFDVVVSNQVIEHLFYPSNFVKEIYRILKKGGYAVISTENLSSWDNILALLFGYTPFSMQFDECKIGNPFSLHQGYELPEYNPHVRIFTYCSLKDIFKLHGFKIEKIVGSGYIIPFSILSRLDPRHCRFITIKVRK